jgi:purine nucleosidase
VKGGATEVAPRLRRFVIDTDIGVDDAVALILALRTPAIDVSAITTVGGNTNVDQCVRNARYVIELCAAPTPVYRGASKPLSEPERRRAPVHGDDGLGDLGLRPLNASADLGEALSRLGELARTGRGELTLVTLGPLTNIALALRSAPEMARGYDRLVAMGGAITPGVAEFNLWSDPVAATEVLGSGLRITVVPIEVSQGTTAFDASDRTAVSRMGTRISEFVQAMCGAAMKRNATDVAGLPDAIAMAIAIDPSLVTRSHSCQINVQSNGALICSCPDDRTEGIEVVDEIDEARYKQMVRSACR